MSSAPTLPGPPTGPLDLLGFPLSGAQVIEASAGTGKTWTLSALYLRLLLEPRPDGRWLLPPDLLVMTFTEAATQELRKRIRERIVMAEDCFRRGDDWQGKDSFLPRLRERFARERWPEAAQRLALAAQWMDEAAIYTLHGWSSRMLRQHAFDSGSLFHQEHVEDSEALQREVVRDYWRQHLYALDGLPPDALEHYPRSPDALWSKLRPLLKRIDREPAGLDAHGQPRTPWPAGVAEPADTLQAWVQRRAHYGELEDQVRAQWKRHREALEAQLTLAMDRQLKGNFYPSAQREKYLATMRRWCEEGARLERKALERFSIRKLQDSKLARAEAVEDGLGVFAALQATLDADPGKAPGAELLPHAALWVHAECVRRKQRAGLFDFQDLLQRLHDAVQAQDGHLARTIARQYPVVLVDEFQDTDRWQYGTLHRLYLNDPAPGTALIMIGDPKQAIYSFRGADLPTYLEARCRADGIHTLDENHRSTPGLVRAVNHIFHLADAPFGDLEFHPVRAARHDILPLQWEERALPAMTIWHLAAAGPLAASRLRQQLAEGFATQIVTLLNQGSARPADIAVLVRNGTEASLIREALQRRQLRSVYLSERDSVYDTAEAQDLWSLLEAITRPRSVNALKAALSTRLLGRTPAELDALFADEVAFDAEAERFAGWQQIWQRQGFLAVLQAMLHELGLPARLLDATAARERGERRLTNLLHLGELLQAASQTLQGERALVRHLAQQLRQSETRTEAVQMRLETEAALVKVITLHKSKGLQYPVVFIPFASDFRVDKSADGLPEVDGSPDAARMAEDLRLLYVGFTRAERALFLGAATRKGDFTKPRKKDPSAPLPAPKSALSRLMGRQTEDDLSERLLRWTGPCPDIVAAALPDPDEACWSPPGQSEARRDALQPRRRLQNRWRSTSFSNLVRGLEKQTQHAPTSERDDRHDDATLDNPPAADQAATQDRPSTGAATPWQRFGAGAVYGTLLHDLLEWQLEAGWPLLDAERPQHGWQALVAARATALQLDADQQQLLHDWLIAVARCPLSHGQTVLPSLAELPRTRTWPEMGFTLMLNGTDPAQLDQLVQQHVLTGVARPTLSKGYLQGQLTGFLDLIFEHEGRYYVLDYKSNLIEAGYDLPQLQKVVLEHRYDLQYVLYLVALHRLLTTRLPGYDYDRHVGGALYLFARGIGTAGNGMYHDKPPRELIETLSAGFATGDGP